MGGGARRRDVDRARSGQVSTVTRGKTGIAAVSRLPGMNGELRRAVAMMNHAELTKIAVNIHQQLGLVRFHVGDPRSCPRGWPDEMYFGPGGMIFREIKTVTSRLEHDQATWGRVITEAGGDWAVWHPRDFASGLVDHQLTEIARRR